MEQGVCALRAGPAPSTSSTSSSSSSSSPEKTAESSLFVIEEPLVIRAFSQLPERSEEHTSELQSQFHLVCRLLLEKKKKTHQRITIKEPRTVPPPRYDAHLQRLRGSAPPCEA